MFYKEGTCTTVSLHLYNQFYICQETSILFLCHSVAYIDQVIVAVQMLRISLHISSLVPQLKRMFIRDNDRVFRKSIHHVTRDKENGPA